MCVLYVWNIAARARMTNDLDVNSITFTMGTEVYNIKSFFFFFVRKSFILVFIVIIFLLYESSTKINNESMTE